MITKNKTEKHHICKTGEESWKKCKYMVSFLNTEEDMKRRIRLAIGTYNSRNTF